MASRNCRCQKAAWKEHKESCTPPEEKKLFGAENVLIVDMINQAQKAGDWQGVLKWESRLEEMISEYRTGTNEENSGVAVAALLFCFARANKSEGRFAKAAKLFERRALLAQTMQRYRDQASELCQIGQCLLLESLDDAEEAASWFEKARAVYTLNPQPRPQTTTPKR